MVVSKVHTVAHSRQSLESTFSEMHGFLNLTALEKSSTCTENLTAALKMVKGTVNRSLFATTKTQSAFARVAVVC